MATLQHAFDLDNGPDLPHLSPRYNIAPTDTAEVVLEVDDRRRLESFVFGLIPTWSKDPKFGLHCLNARAETVAEKPAFRSSLKNKRCLVVADGFYEWDRSGKIKIPYFIRLKSNEPFGMAGLWSNWKRPDGKELNSFAIVTTEANPSVGKIHNRMPVILSRENYSEWLSQKIEDPNQVLTLLKPFPHDLLSLNRVSTYVNNSRNKGEDCIKPENVTG